MPTASPRLCQRCKRTVHGQCPHCTITTRNHHDQHRATPAQRGYDNRWRTRIRPAFLREHPLCCLCDALAEVPDHWPTTRRALLAAGVTDVDAFHRMRPLCLSCHARHGARD